MKTYRGYRAGGGCAIEVHCGALVTRGLKSPSACVPDDAADAVTYFLPSRLDLLYITPGFDWGRQGSKPRMEQLALALLADAVGEDLALEVYEWFAASVIATCNQDALAMTDEDVMHWCRCWKDRAQKASPEELVGT
jgi:hypothetical protein